MQGELSGRVGNIGMRRTRHLAGGQYEITDAGKESAMVGFQHLKCLTRGGQHWQAKSLASTGEV